MNTSHPSLLSRLSAGLDRWGLWLALLLGAFVLFTGLGTHGLWEPWEMDRADLSRRLTQNPEILVAQTADTTPFPDDTFLAEADLRARRITLSPGADFKAIHEALAQRPYAALILDTAVLLPQDDDTRWATAGRQLDSLLAHSHGTPVVLSHDPDTHPAGHLSQRLSTAAWQARWEKINARYTLDPDTDAPAHLSTFAKLGTNDPLELTFLDLNTPAALLDIVADAYHPAAFTADGTQLTLPPLETWLRSLAYQLGGANEWSTRLPSALLSLLTLFVLLHTVHTLWGGRMAFLTGLVLSTSPIFFLQARHIAGEPSLMLALTLVGAYLLRLARPPTSPDAEPDAPAASAWRAPLLLGLALVLAFFGKGTYGLALAALILGAYAAIQSLPLRHGAWLATFAFSAAALLAEWLSHTVHPGSPLSGLSFTAALFSEGPDIYRRTFDLVIVQLGYGFAPWSPFLVVSLGLVLTKLLRRQDPQALAALLWFTLPLLALMAALGPGNQFLFAGATAGAVLVAWLLDAALRQPARTQAFLAFVLLLMFFIMRRELKISPEPLVAFLAFDPPFQSEGSLRFPESIAISSLFKQGLMLLALVSLLYFSHATQHLRRLWSLSRRPGVLSLMASGAFFLMGLLALIRAGMINGRGTSRRFADSIQASQKALISRLTSEDPLFWLALSLVGLLLLALFVRRPLTRACAALARRLQGPARLDLIAWAIAAFAALAALITTVIGTTFPPDAYLSELLFAPHTLGALLGLALLTLPLHRQAQHSLSGARHRASLWLMTAAFLALLLTFQITRDATGSYPALLPLLSLFFVATAIGYLNIAPQAVLPRVNTLLIFLGVMLWAFTFPLYFRAGAVLSVTLPQLADPNAHAFKSVFLNPLFLLLGLLSLSAWALLFSRQRNFRWVQSPPAWVTPLLRRGESLLNHGALLVVAACAVALIGTGAYLFQLEPAIATNLSQKHLIDTWHASAGKDAPLFKHGDFGGGGQRDNNFYTAGAREIPDRQSALKVLLAEEDQIVDVKSPSGDTHLHLPGHRASDQDISPVWTGFATQLSQHTLSDDQQSWVPGALVGKVLVDHQGRSWPILDNDATRITLAEDSHLTFALHPPARAFYAVADTAAQAKSSATEPQRRALLLPADALSDLNYAFRRLSGGRHLPVLDGSNYRVLLTSSWLNEGEDQQNRLALATFDQERFDALDNPALSRLYANLEDTLEIVGYHVDKDTVKTGDSVTISVYYKTLKPLRQSMKIFIHLDKVGGGGRIAGDHWPLNPTTDGEDNKECKGCFRTDHWLVGDIVRDDYAVKIPQGNRGEYIIWVGMFNPTSNKRLVVKDFEKGRVQHDGQNRVGLGVIQIQ